MKFTLWASAALLAMGNAALSQDSSTPTIKGKQIVTETAAPARMGTVKTIYSGWRFRSSETQALETDDFDNPAFVFADQAVDL